MSKIDDLNSKLQAGITYSNNITYLGDKPNFTRDQFDTKDEMDLAMDNGYIDEGHLSYCKEDKKTYKATLVSDSLVWKVFGSDLSDSDDGTTNTKSLAPIESDKYNLGTDSKRYNEVYSNSASLSLGLDTSTIAYNHSIVMDGVTWKTIGGGKISKVWEGYNTLGAEATGYAICKLDVNYSGIANVAAGDICFGLTHLSEGNDTETSDSKNGNFHFKGYKPVYFYIEKVIGTEDVKDTSSLSTSTWFSKLTTEEINDFKNSGENNKYIVIQSRFNKGTLSNEDYETSWSDSTLPQSGMMFCSYGNSVNNTRQSSTIETTSYVLLLTGLVSWNYSSSNMMYLRGKLDGFKIKTRNWSWDTNGWVEGQTISLSGYGVAYGNSYTWGTATHYERQPALVSQQAYYLLSNLETGITSNSGDWITSPSKVTKDYPYLWKYYKQTFEDNHTVNTEATIADRYAVVEAITITESYTKYAVSENGSTKPETFDLSEYPSESANDGKYIWSWTYVKYSDGTETNTYGVNRAGIDGSGVASSSVDYKMLSSSTDPDSISGWGAYPTKLIEGNWLYTRNTVVYSDKTETHTYSVIKIGTGAMYAGCSEYYALGSSADTAPNHPDAGERVGDPVIDSEIWSTDKPKKTNNSTPYLWNFEISRDSNGNCWVTEPRCIGNFSKGIDSILELYALSANATPGTYKDTDGTEKFYEFPQDISSSDWSDEQASKAPTATQPYQWNKTITNYNDGDPYISYHISAVRGNDGDSIISQYAKALESGEVDTTQTSDSFSDGYVWMRTKSGTDGVWSNWMRIVGEQGIAGDYTDFSFARSKWDSYTGCPDDITDKPSSEGGSWEDCPPSYSDEKPWLWMKTVQMEYDKTTKSHSVKSGTTATYARITGDDGKSIGIKETLITYCFVSESDGSSQPSDDKFTYTKIDDIPNVTDGGWLWTWTKVTYDDTPATITNTYSVSRVGIDGKGLSDSDIYYYQDEDGTLNPENITEWSTVFPTIVKDYWIYTKTVLVYSDSNTTTQYSITQNGTGSAYLGCSEYYNCNSNNTKAPSGSPTPGPYKNGELEWEDGTSGWTSGNKETSALCPYLWNFEISRDSSGNQYVTEPVCIGNFAKGVVSITETYAISQYSFTNDTEDHTIDGETVKRKFPTDIYDSRFDGSEKLSSQSSWTDEQADAAPTSSKRYQWNKTTTTYNDSTVDEFYHISAVRGEDGVGIVTKYAPSNSTGDGADESNETSVFNTNCVWMKTSRDSGSTWSTWMRIVGESGTDGPYTSIDFARSAYETTEGDTCPSDITEWSDGPTLATTEQPWLWMKTVRHELDEKNSLKAGTPHYSRVTGDKGKAIEISSTSVQYVYSTDGKNHPSDSASWTLTIPDIVKGSYLWSKTTVTYNDTPATSTVTYSVSKIGVDAFSSQVIDYSQQENQVSDPGTIKEWGDYPSNLSDGWWLYVRSRITYSNGEVGTSYTVSKIGSAANYAGCSEYYAKSSSSTSAPTGTPEKTTYNNGESLSYDSTIWSTDRPSLDINEPYLWNFEVSRDSNGKQFVTSPICIGNFSRGISEISEAYAISQYNFPNGTSGKYPSDIDTWDDEVVGNPVTAPTKDKPYQWNKTTVWYNDGDSDVSYHISSRLDVAISLVVEYAPSLANGDPDEDSISETYNSNSVFMRTRTSDTTSWDGISWMKIVGEDGNGGPYTDFSFAISKDRTADSGSCPTDITEWEDSPVATTTAQPYLWMKTVQKVVSDSTGEYIESGSATYTCMTQDQVSVEFTEVKYAIGSSGTTAPTRWYDYIQSPADENTAWYTWTKTTVKYTNGKESVSYTVSRNGIDGKGIQNTVIEYYQSSEQVSSDSITTWNSDMPAPVDQEWLYTRTTYIYSDGSQAIEYKSIQLGTGSYYSGTSEYYALSISGDTFPATGLSQTTYTKNDSITSLISEDWSTARPSQNDMYEKPYLWNFEVSQDSAGNKYVTSPVCIGNFSKGIESIVETYCISAKSVPESTINGKSNLDSNNKYIRRYPSDIFDPDQVGKGDQFESTKAAGQLTWDDEVGAAQPTTEKPYQWNKTKTSYTDGTYDIIYHISAIRTEGVSIIAEYNSTNSGTGHDSFKAGDKYMRTKIGSEGTWGEWIQIVGEDGIKGDHTNFTFAYSAYNTSTNPQTPPTDLASATWADAPETSSSKPYLWMKKVNVTYNSSTDTGTEGSATYSCISGKAVTINSRSTAYCDNGTSSTQPDETGGKNPYTLSSYPTSGVDGHYIWSKTVVNYSDGSSTATYGMSRAGIDGEGVTGSSVQYIIKSEYAEPSTISSGWGDYPTDLTDHEGEWLYSKTTVNFKTMDPSVSYTVAQIGVGASYAGVAEYYALGTSSTEIPGTIGVNYPAADNYESVSSKGTSQQYKYISPTDPWSQDRPTMDSVKDGKCYLWNFEISADSSGRQFVTQPICIGNFAKGIQKVDEYYAISGTDAKSGNYPSDSSLGKDSDNSGWDDEASVKAPTKDKPYQWNKTVTTYTDSSVEYSYHVSAVRGGDGTSVKAMYNSTASNTGAHDTYQTTDKYMKTSSDGGTSWGEWIQIVGEKGTNGDYTDIDFARSSESTSSSAASCPTDIGSSWADAPVAETTEKPYLWMRSISHSFNKTTGTETIGTATYACISGKSVSISSTSVEYVYTDSTSQPGSSAGWQSSIPTSPGTDKVYYLWTKTTVNYSDGKKTETYSVSREGIDGKGVSGKIEYAVSEEHMDPKTNDSSLSWGTTYPTNISDGWWLYTKTTTTYLSDGSTTTSYSISQYGVGSTYNGTQEWYAAGTSESTPPGTAGVDYPVKNTYSKGATIAGLPSNDNGIWKQSRPTSTALHSAPYIWNFEVSSNSAGVSFVTDPICIGNFAKGISSIVETYGISAKGSGNDDPGDVLSWTDEQTNAVPTKEKPYQWNQTETIYNDGSNDKTYHISAIKPNDYNGNKFGYGSKLEVSGGNICHTSTGVVAVGTFNSNGVIFINFYDGTDKFKTGQTLAASCKLKIKSISGETIPSTLQSYITFQNTSISGTGTVNVTTDSDSVFLSCKQTITEEYFSYIRIYAGTSYSGKKCIVIVEDLKIEDASDIIGTSTTFSGLADDNIPTGQNLVTGTNTLTDWISRDDSAGIIHSSETYQGCKCVYYSGGTYYDSDSNKYARILESESLSTLKANTWYTISYFAKGSGTATLYGRCNPTAGNGAEFTVDPDSDNEICYDSGSNPRVKAIKLSSTWERKYLTFKTTSDLTSFYFYFSLEADQNVSGNYIYIAMPKLEEGQKATDWQLSEDDRIAKTPAVLDLTNETDTLPVDSEGHVVDSSGVSISTSIKLYDGDTVVNPSDYTLSNSTSLTLWGKSPSVTTGTSEITYTWNFTYSTTTVYSGRQSVTLTATYKGSTYSVIFTVGALKSGSVGVSPTVYNVMPNPSSISFGIDSSTGKLTGTKTIYCGYTKTTGGTTTSTEKASSNIIESGKCYLFYKYGSSSGWTSYPSSGVTINSGTTETSIEFLLASGTSVTSTNILDREVVTINKDGENGSDGADGAQPNLYGYGNIIEGAEFAYHTDDGLVALFTTANTGTSSNWVCLNIYDSNGSTTWLESGKKYSLSADITVVSETSYSGLTITLGGWGYSAESGTNTAYVAGNSTYHISSKGTISESSTYAIIYITGFSVTSLGNFKIIVKNFKIESAENISGTATLFNGLASDNIATGTNLISSSDLFDSSKGWNVSSNKNYTASIVENCYMGCSAIYIKPTSTQTNYSDAVTYDINVDKLKTNTTYTFSYYSKGVTGQNNTILLYSTKINSSLQNLIQTRYYIENGTGEYFINTSSGGDLNNYLFLAYNRNSTTWRRYVIRFTTPSSFTNTSKFILKVFLNSASFISGNEFYIAMPKLEEGDKATNWIVSVDDQKPENALTADLTNEMDSFVCTSSRVIDGDQTVETYFNMYYGVEKQILTALDISGTSYNSDDEDYSSYSGEDGLTVSANYTTGLISVTKENGYSIPESGLWIDIIGSCKYGSLTKRFTITPVCAGENGEAAVIYQLKPSISAVQLDESSSPSTGTSTITCGVTKTTGGSTTEMSSSTMTTDGLSMRIYYNNSASYSPYTIGSSISTGSHTGIKFELYKGSTKLDTETIPYVQDGTNGSNGEPAPQPNLISRTDTRYWGFGDWRDNGNTTLSIDGKYGEYPVIKLVTSDKTNSGVNGEVGYVVLKPNTVYTYSVMVKAASGISSGITIHVRVPSVDSNNSHMTIQSSDRSITTSWKRNYITFKTEDTSNEIRFIPYIYTSSSAADIWFCCPKLEEYDSPTAWCCTDDEKFSTGITKLNLFGYDTIDNTYVQSGTIGISGTSDGFAANVSSAGVVRMKELVTSKSYYSVSGYVTSNVSSSLVFDICDASEITGNSTLSLTANTRTKFEYKFYASNYNGGTTYTFLDIEFKNSGQYLFEEFKVENTSNINALSTPYDGIKSSSDTTVKPNIFSNTQFTGSSPENWNLASTFGNITISSAEPQDGICRGIRGYICKLTTESTSTSDNYNDILKQKVDNTLLKADTWYTISFCIKANTSTDIPVNIHFYNTSSGSDLINTYYPAVTGFDGVTNTASPGNSYFCAHSDGASYLTGLDTYSTATKWRKYSYTFKTGAMTSVSTGNTYFLLRVHGGVNQYREIYFAMPKLEEGQRATDWCPNESERVGTNGLRGAILRGPSQWQEGVTYQGGGDYDEYQDMVTLGNSDTIYLCHVTHTSVDPDNYPSSHSLTENWTESNPWSVSEMQSFVATKLLLSEQIKTSIMTAVQAQIDDLIVGKLSTYKEGGASISIANGLIEVFGANYIKNIEFGIDSNGYAVLKYFDNDGTLLYNLGPNGIMSQVSAEYAKYTEYSDYYLLGDSLSSITTNGQIITTYYEKTKFYKWVQGYKKVGTVTNYTASMDSSGAEWTTSSFSNSNKYVTTKVASGVEPTSLFTGVVSIDFKNPHIGYTQTGIVDTSIGFITLNIYTNGVKDSNTYFVYFTVTNSTVGTTYYLCDTSGNKVTCSTLQAYLSETGQILLER